jgi:hypothetical protein
MQTQASTQATRAHTHINAKNTLSHHSIRRIMVEIKQKIIVITLTITIKIIIIKIIIIIMIKTIITIIIIIIIINNKIKKNIIAK